MKSGTVITIGDLVTAEFQQIDGQIKPRPALVMKEMPRGIGFLLCAVSKQIKWKVDGFDEHISETDKDFIDAKLKEESIVRLGWVATIPYENIKGAFGRLPLERINNMNKRLANYLSNTNK